MSLSLVIPAYNCRDAIGATIEQVLGGLAGSAPGFELIVVDDGSTDGTADAAARIRHEALRVIAAERNLGKGGAVRRGVLAARGDVIAFTDADLAYPVDQIARVAAAVDTADVAVATRVSADSRFLMSPRFFRYLYTRHVASRMFNRVVNAVLRLGVEDSQAGLKAFRRDAAQAIFSRQTLDSFTFDCEVLLIARRLGLRVAEVAVLYRYDSEPSTIAFARDSIGALRDLWTIRGRDRAGAYR